MSVLPWDKQAQSFRLFSLIVYTFYTFYMFYTAEISYWQGEGLTTEDGGQRMGDGGRTTKDRGLRCDQRALPFSCIPCISWFNSLRLLRSLRLKVLHCRTSFIHRQTRQGARHFAQVSYECQAQR